MKRHVSKISVFLASALMSVMNVDEGLGEGLELKKGNTTITQSEWSGAQDGKRCTMKIDDTVIIEALVGDGEQKSLYFNANSKCAVDRINAFSKAMKLNIGLVWSKGKAVALRKLSDDSDSWVENGKLDAKLYSIAELKGMCLQFTKVNVA